MSQRGCGLRKNVENKKFHRLRPEKEPTNNQGGLTESFAMTIETSDKFPHKKTSSRVPFQTDKPAP